jgi:hypothetical protein
LWIKVDEAFGNWIYLLIKFILWESIWAFCSFMYVYYSLCCPFFVSSPLVFVLLIVSSCYDVMFCFRISYLLIVMITLNEFIGWFTLKSASFFFF